MSRLAKAPDVKDVDVNSREFRNALKKAGRSLEGRGVEFSVYSRHSHAEVPVSEGQVIFEQPFVGDDGGDDGVKRLKLIPVSWAEANRFGKPSCWAFAPGGDGEPAEVVVMRYAANSLHKGSGVHVTSERFKKELQEIANAFVAEGIEKILEVNVTARYLFSAPVGRVTREVTCPNGIQVVDFVPTPEEIANGDWGLAACFSFNQKRQPVVAGFCDDC